MKLRFIDEDYPTKVKEKEINTKKDDETYGLGFIPSKDTIKAIENSKKLSRTTDGAFSDFDSFWKDLMSDDD